MTSSSCEETTSYLEEAIRYSENRGWCVIPTFQKIAAVKWKSFQYKRPQVEDLAILFCNKHDGLGVMFGSVSRGLACRDFDSLESYEVWSLNNKTLSKELPTVRTKRGMHVYFTGPELFVKLEDGEYRGDPGHYSILPPSKRADGLPYEWIVPLPKGNIQYVDPIEVGLYQKTDETLLEVMRSTAYTAQLSVLRSIEETIPNGEGHRNNCIFHLCRRLKFLPCLKGVGVNDLRGVMLEWFNRALPQITTKEFDISWADFRYAWDRIKTPIGEGSVDIAYQFSLDKDEPNLKKMYGDGPIFRLAKLCKELQRLAGDSNFFLDCRTAGRLLEVHNGSASRFLKVLQLDKMIDLRTKGSQATHKANEYRWIGPY